MHLEINLSDMGYVDVTDDVINTALENLKY